MDSLTEQQKCEKGLMYDTAFPGREEAHLVCADLCFDYNHTRPSDTKTREAILRKLFGAVGANPYVEPSIFCGFGQNIYVGDNFFANNNCVFVDPGTITFGNNVFIGPNCGFYTAHHPIQTALRNQGYEYAFPIQIGDNVWIGGNTVVLPGVHIGSNVVIGAGSVVTRDIPNNTVAYGNPCKVRKTIPAEDISSDK